MEFEVGVEQFAQRAAAAHPLPGGQFRPGSGHPPDQAGDHGRALDCVEAEALQNGGEAEPADGGEANGLDADRAGAGELQRGDIDLGEVGGRFGRARRCCPRDCRPAGGTVGGEAGGVALGQSLDGFGFGEQAGLRGQQRLDAGTQTRPVRLRQVELAAKVEQGHLADLLADTLGGDEAVGEIGLAGRFVPGSGAADEHAPEAGPGGGIRSRGFLKYYVTT